MCGITGIAFAEKNKFSYLEEMLAAIAYRGPDSFGLWQDEVVALGHRRLSIIDLSPTGHQPMLSSSGRYVITFNGEIYNYLQLKQELPSQNFKGSSDTEVLLACIEQYGMEQTLKKLNGMFAFAVWDKQEKTLYLARDRFGEKPLYYGWMNDAFIFASELKPFKKYPDWQPIIDQEALALYLQYAYIPAPYCIYKGIKKLEPGFFLTLKQQTNQEELKTYWSAIDSAAEQANNKIVIGDSEAIQILDEKLTTAIRLRTIADVPLGAFLSGGIDSSTVVALMQKNRSLPVKTFTIGFEAEKFNEAPYAKAVAEHLKTEHTEVYLTERDALNVVPSLAYIYDEPFADSSQIPTFLVSKIARQKVTVCLSGDAGDELFGGYNRYVMAENIANKLKFLPVWLKHSIAKFILNFPVSSWDHFYSHFVKKLRPGFEVAGFGDKLHKLAGLIAQADNKQALYQYLISQIPEPNKILLRPSDSTVTDFSVLPKQLDYVSWMMLADTVAYLPGDILTKVDRASMAVSLESRVPLLDPAVFEFAWSLPIDMKIRDGKTKWLLRQVLYRYVPKDLIERPKMGFGIPIDSWLRDTLREWAEELLDSNKMQAEGYFNVAVVHELWQQHVSGKRNFATQLWTILMFQAWLRNE